MNIPFFKKNFETKFPKCIAHCTTRERFPGQLGLPACCTPVTTAQVRFPDAQDHVLLLLLLVVLFLLVLLLFLLPLVFSPTRSELSSTLQVQPARRLAASGRGEVPVSLLVQSMRGSLAVIDSQSPVVAWMSVARSIETRACVPHTRVIDDPRSLHVSHERFAPKRGPSDRSQVVAAPETAVVRPRWTAR